MKAVQIAIQRPSEYMGYAVLFAVMDDGTVWRLVLNSDPHWVRVPLPDEEE